MYEQIDKTKYTPMMRQYLEIKEQYPDTLVFFRLGDFYEMFFNDALTASRELEIILTGRDAGTNNDRVPMCGVPFHAVDTYIEKLSEKGYKVAIVEQLEQPGVNKIVKRDVTRVITPGTNIDEGYLSEKTNNFIGCVDKIVNGFCLCYTDLSTGESFVTQINGNETVLIEEINKLKIKEVVTNSSFSQSITDKLSKLYGVVVSTETAPKIDEYLNPLLSSVDALYKPTCELLLSYIIKTQKRVLVHLQAFKYYSFKEYLRLDYNAIRNLELVESLKGNRFKNNLFSILDKCHTAMGSRFLKKSILFPLVDIYKINERLDFIEEMQNNYLTAEDIKSQLLDVYDLERIIGRISFGTSNPKDLLQLKRSIKTLPEIKKLLGKVKGKISKQKAEKITTYNELYDLLDKGINEDAPFTLKDGGVIKPGFSEELDKIRDIASTNKEFLTNLEIRERERTKIKNLKVGYNRVFGYFIEVSKSNIGLVKDEYGYIRKQTTSNSERYITEELKEREALILRSSETCLKLEYDLFNQLRNKCKEHSASLQETSKLIAELDMLLAFAMVSKANNYTRPTFSLYDEFDIKAGRHPVIESVSDKDFIPNDLTLYNNERVLLITGPNMAGKSTYMRQNALIVIMAQMGCFIPATKATLPIFDQIFTRIGSSDDISSGESTFMTEMLEVNEALQNATMRSLIILDEVGRGTATFDGMALAQAIIEYLHDEIGAKTFFSTHYHELTELDKSLPFLRNVHVDAKVQVKDNTEKLVFLHKVIPGPSDQSYGINVASLAKIPQKVTLRAEDILSKLTQKEHYDTELLSKNNYQEPVIIKEEIESYPEVIEQLKTADIDNMRPIDALMFLNDLKKKMEE